METIYERVDSQETLLEKPGHDIENAAVHRPKSNFRWLQIHISIIFIYTMIFGLLFVRLSENYQHGSALIYSPAREAVIPEKQLFEDDLTELNKYRGPPRPELDDAWHELVRYSNIRVSASDLRTIDRKSVQLSDDSGMYMAELNVHHQLHCLKVIRQAFYPEYYDLPMRHMSEHMDHCLDNLRQLIMCKADVSLQTYDWLDNNPRPFANFKIEHECYNWDSINNWARDHSFDLYDNKTLLHPYLGPSFPVNEKGQLILTDDPDPLNGVIITPAVE